MGIHPVLLPRTEDEGMHTIRTRRNGRRPGNRQKQRSQSIRRGKRPVGMGVMGSVEHWHNGEVWRQMMGQIELYKRKTKKGKDMEDEITTMEMMEKLQTAFLHLGLNIMQKT